MKMKYVLGFFVLFHIGCKKEYEPKYYEFKWYQTTATYYSGSSYEYIDVFANENDDYVVELFTFLDNGTYGTEGFVKLKKNNNLIFQNYGELSQPEYNVVRFEGEIGNEQLIIKLEFSDSTIALSCNSFPYSKDDFNVDSISTVSNFCHLEEW